MYKIIKDHKDFLIVNKSPEVSLHRDSGENGLAGRIRSDLGITELYTVHRLDKVTSGLLVFMKSGEAARQFSNMLRNRKIEKYYIALSDRKPKKTQGLIKGDMKKARRGAWKLMRTMENPAVTRFFSYPVGKGLRLFVLRPYTGKTHQLRVALKSIGSPVIGDPLYAAQGRSDRLPDRGYLHSYGLKFGWRGRKYQFVCKPDSGIYFDEKVREMLDERCSKPWELNWPE